MTSVVEIETLALDGFSEEDARRAAERFETTLSDLLNRHGLPEGKTSQDVAGIDLGQLPIGANTPEGLGQELARALFNRVWS